MHDLSKNAKQELRLFINRIGFIKKQLDVEVEPVRAISRDHLRVNRNGISLELLEQRGERVVPSIGSPFNQRSMAQLTRAVTPKQDKITPSKFDILLNRNQSVAARPGHRKGSHQPTKTTITPHSPSSAKKALLHI